MVIEDFVLPFEGKLDVNNRWVKLAKIIPWERIEMDYADLFPSNTGTVAKPLRMALGSLIIKERCGFSDREAVEQIAENPYLQYFIDLEKYQIEPPFDSSLMVFFRKRLDQKVIKKINELICQKGKPKAPKHKEPKDKDPGTPPDGSETAQPEENVSDDTCATAEKSEKPEDNDSNNRPVDAHAPQGGSNHFEVWRPEEHKGQGRSGDRVRGQSGYQHG